MWAICRVVNTFSVFEAYTLSFVEPLELLTWFADHTASDFIGYFWVLDPSWSLLTDVAEDPGNDSVLVSSPL